MKPKFNDAGVFLSGVPVETVTAAPTAENLLGGALSHAATTASATLLTVPAGRTWSGTVSIAAAAATAAGSATEGQARAVVSTAGAGAAPSGTVAAAEARSAPNAATGTVGNAGSTTVTVPVVVVAPAGNPVTLMLTSTITNGVVDVTAHGVLA